MVALARIQGEGGESLGDALPLQLHNLLATRPEISGQDFQACTDVAGKCRRVHVPVYLQHPGCEVLRRLAQLLARELVVEQPADVRDHGLMNVDVSEFLDQPTRAPHSLIPIPRGSHIPRFL